MNVLSGKREEWRRVLHEGQPKWVRSLGDRLVFGDGRHIAEAEATYLPPCDPTKILCIHLNYESRRVEFRAPKLETPTYFQKPVTALNSHRGTVCRPAGHKYLNYEGEVGVIIGKPMRNVGREETWDYIAGFAPANDVGCQDYRETDAGSMLRVKGMDGFCPIGPGIVSGVDIRESTLRTYINGKVVQEGAIAEMIFPIDYILADLCRFITLLPGDIILSGTPKNSRPMNIGDTVEVEVSGIGRLSNRVAEAPPAAHKIGHQPTDTEAVRRVALGSDSRLEAR
ncbi:MAG: fumarylacetoacetate hydrolase family protein [Candidatus Binatus sp.]|uniref:fumarylacetoacetate hydrolase family protein n=1 Tax=Candidatus Binatus sp. TaxID=2811406 RepID=UPI0027258E80|nr:fumarylacetoacetate hydrolase family protein [Candidatus Binatus sp.]MDO8431574.1 fumarylacetoacetate hydrolase family protein [Candidatus Binatus sp.]